VIPPHNDIDVLANGFEIFVAIAEKWSSIGFKRFSGWWFSYDPTGIQTPT